MTKQGMGALFGTIGCLLAGLAWGQVRRMELHLNPAPAEEVGSVPVRTGVLLDPGDVTEEGGIRLLVDEREADLQTEVLARYNDRSVKWVLLDFVATPGKHLALEFGEGVTRTRVDRAIRVTESTEGISVDTGILKAFVSRKGDGMPAALSLDLNGDGTYAADERLGVANTERANWMDFVHTPTITSLNVMSRTVPMGELDPSRVEIKELVTEVSGPLHVVIKVVGNYRYRFVGTSVVYPYPNPQHRDTRPRDVGRIPFVMRLHFYRDRGAIEVQHTFIYEGDPDRDFATSLALAAPMPASADVVCTIGSDAGATPIPCGASSLIGLSQTSADHFSIWRAGTDAVRGIIAEGRRAAGWIDVSIDRWGVTAAVWRSWQNHPKGFLAMSSPGQLRALLWPSEAGPMVLKRYTREWGVGETGARGGVDSFALSRHAARGVAKTHRVLFNFHAGMLPEGATPSGVQWFLQKVHAWPSLEHMCRAGSGIGEAISPVEPGRYDELEKMSEACLDWMLFNQEHFRWYGMFNYGDVQQCFQNVHRHGRWESDYGRWGWFNGDASGHKPYKALLMHFLRTGRRDIFDLFEAEILHIIDVDMVNSEEYPWDSDGWRDMRGCGHRHNGQHWACFFVGSRAARVAYFSALYYLTGDERLRDVLDLCADAARRELGEDPAGRGGHSSTQDMTSRLFYSLERTGDAKDRDLIASKWEWVLHGNRGAAELQAAQQEDDDFGWVRTPAERALTARRSYRYPGDVVGALANGIRYLQGKEDVQRYRDALDKAVEHMETRYRAGPQGLPRDQWPGRPAGPVQGNWNPIPNLMPIVIHALKIHDAAQKEGEQ